MGGRSDEEAGGRRDWAPAGAPAFVAALVAALSGPLAGAESASAQYLGGGSKGASDAQVADLEQMGDKFAALAGAFEADDWDWRPMEGVRSVREVAALIAAEASLFPTMWGFEAPSWVPDPAFGSELSRLAGLAPDELVGELERSFAHLLALATGLDRSERARPVNFFGLEVPLETALTLTANDMHEHLGQFVAYARMRRVVPPWSRRERPEAPRAGDIFVANLRTSDVSWFDGTSGAYRGAFVESGSGGLEGATGLAFGPDGDLYVSSSRTHRILRYDGSTGAFEGVFVDGGELEAPFSLTFGPDGDLYVSSGTGHRVLRFDGGSGAFVGVAAQGGGLEQPIGLAFGPEDGLLYVVSSAGRNVLRFDHRTGQPLGAFAADSLRFPSDLAFGPDGHLYVSSAASSSVVRFDGDTGAFMDFAVRLPGEGGAPVGLAFRDDGSLVVGDFARSRLYLLEGVGSGLRPMAETGLAGPENVAVRRVP